VHASFSYSDYALLITYVVASLSVGLWFARSQKSVEAYFLAGRSAPSWVVAISLISSDTSAISYMGVAALVFLGNLQFFPAVLAMPLGALFVSYAFVPFLAKHKVFTIYEYLEHRFSLQVRTVASALFILMRGAHLSVALYAAGLALSQVMNLPMWFSLLALGGLTTLYTVLGGMKAVLWTDVIQFFVMMGGLIAVLFGVAMAFNWDLAQIWRLATHPPAIPVPWLQGQISTASHTRMFNFEFNLTEMTFWVVIINSFITFIGSYGSDQVLVQRYLSAGSKKEMARSLMGAGLLTMPVNVIFFATGVFLIAFYYQFLNVPGHEWVAGLSDANRVMTHFISNGLPGKLGALVIAGLFAGTMSSFSAGLNSLSTATYVDFVTRFGKKAATEKSGVLRAKLLTLMWGILTVGVAGLIGSGDSIFETGAKVLGPFAGPLLGMFLLGMLSKRANNFGAISGAIVGAAATVYVTYFTHVHWLWFFEVGSIGGLVAGYLLSFLRPPPAPRQTAA
jgi:SSS family transporter